VPLLVAPSLVLGADTHTASDPDVLQINGKTIRMSELEGKYPEALFQARTMFYETQRKTIDDFIGRYLLEEQARKENLTTDELLKKHTSDAVGKDPSDEALRVYYEGIDTTESFDNIKSKIVDAIRDRRVAKAKTAYLQSLRNSASIVLRLAPPRAPQSKVKTPTRGPANAPITLLEYADYECPYCQQIQPAIDKVEREFKGMVAYQYKDFPLPMHANAQKAAEASRCAESQGKYWEYHDRLVTTKQLDLSALKSHARALNLNAAAFDKCLDNGEAADRVKETATEAQTLQLQGTPTFFINGRFVSGNISYETLRDVIEEELSASGVKKPVASGQEARGVKNPEKP